MLNLLFISDSPKADYIKSVLQPVLKVIIDVVTDFDHGLKDVFEKRPTTVCIQDQISGVTGESVARHIQMLLGNSAPTFILLHTGNGKARTIKGLYEHIIDLSQPDETLAEDIKGTLKSLLGDQWDKVYIPPQLTPASILSSKEVPEESGEIADTLVDDLLSDLETTGFTAIDAQPSGMSFSGFIAEKPVVIASIDSSSQFENMPGVIESDRAQSISDDLAEMLVAEAHKPILNEKRIDPPYSINDRSEVVFNLTPKQVPPRVTPISPILPVLPELPEVSAPLKNPAGTDPVRSVSEPAAVSAPRTPIPKVASKTALTVASLKAETPVTPPAAEFKISQNAPLAEDHIPEDLLLAFEANYRSESFFLRRSVIFALICLVCIVGGWFIVKKKPQLISSIKLRVMSFTEKKQVQVAAPSVTIAQPIALSTPQSAAVSSLPTFISKDDHDSTYAVKNPGWERYVNKSAEFRLFGTSGQIQAVQVLAVNNTPVPESLLKKVLLEVAGDARYNVISRKMKAGIRVETGKVGNKSDVIIYRKNGAVKAFVVSIN